MPPFMPGAKSNKEMPNGVNFMEDDCIIIQLSPEDKELVQRYKDLQQRITKQAMDQLGA